MFSSLSWSTWDDVPSHLKTLDGSELSAFGIGSLYSAIGPGMGGAGAGNWHIGYDPFVVDGHDVMIPFNRFGSSMSYTQRYILATHGYGYGFVTNVPSESPEDNKAIISPSSSFLRAPSPIYDDSNDYEEVYDEDNDSEMSETYHVCMGIETLDKICQLYDLEFSDLLKTNDDVLGVSLESLPSTIPPKGVRIWVSIYED